MIPAFLTGLSGKVIAGLALGAFITGAVATATYQWNAAIDRAVSAENARVVSHFRAQMAESNEKVAKAQLAQANTVAIASAAAAATEIRESQLLAELEMKNASLPNGDACGLDDGRVRLLDGSPGRANGDRAAPGQPAAPR